MIAVLQRVKCASVSVDGVVSGSIEHGLYILLGVEQGDTFYDSDLLAEKISKLRIFSDDNDKMNLSVVDVGGEALVVSNFTLNANYSHGNRPDYLAAAAPDVAKQLYDVFCEKLALYVNKVAKGVFGEHMISSLVTDGPVTIVMNSKLLGGKKK